MSVRRGDEGLVPDQGWDRTALAAVWSVAIPAVGMVVGMEGARLSADAETGFTRVSALALFGVATSLLLLAFLALTRRGGRRGVATVTAAAGWVVGVFAVLEIKGDKLYEHGFHPFFGAAPSLVYATPLLAAIAFALSFWLSWRGRIARFDRLRRRLAMAALGLTAAIAAIALGRSRRPDPDTYWPSLPVVGTLAVDLPIVLPDRRRLTLASDACNPIAWAPGDEGSAPGCRLSGIRSSCVLCATLTVRHDALSDFYWLFGEERRPVLVFKGTDVETRNAVRVRDLAGVLGPPIAWTLGAAFGVAMASALVVAAHRIERRRAALVAAAGGRSEGDARSADEAGALLDLRAARLYALAATTCVLCAGPLIVGAALGQW